MTPCVEIQCDEELVDHPAVQLIRETLSGLDSFEFADHISLFESILKSDLALQALKLGLRKVAQDDQYQLSHFVMEGLIRGWMIVATEHFRVSIGYRSSEWEGAEIASSAQADAGPVPPDAVSDPALPSSLKMEPYPFDMFLGVLSVGQLDVDRYRLVEPAQEGGDHTLAFEGTVRMQPGSSMFLRAGHDLTFARLKGTFVYFEITGNPKARLLPRFDPVDHSFTGWISGDPTSSRIEILTRTIADFGYAPGAEVVGQLTHHVDHHVRWNSIRHLLRLDEVAGIERVRQAARHDNHADVREVAQLVLDGIDEASAED